MNTVGRTSLEESLDQYDDAAWERVLADLVPYIHEVDRNATRIWFKFFPIALLRALERAADPAELAQRLLLEGRYFLKDQIDSSHRFLYGHRYWPQVKRAVAARAEALQSAEEFDLVKEIRELARFVAAELKVDESLLVGITAVAFMTLEHVGLDAFKAARGAVQIDERHARKSPEQILKERARDDSQGLFGFLKTVDKEWTVTFDEYDREGRYKLKHMQDLAYGAAGDTRDWRARDPRCKEGPIPVQCRAASCGTCWVGVLGGAEKLSEVARLEGKKIKEFGYIDTNEPKPLIRLACQAQSFGAVSIVIPPWNGVFGKYLRAEPERISNTESNVETEETDISN